MKMNIFILIGVKRLKYQNTQILDLRYQKMRMMQKDSPRKYQRNNIKWGKICEDALICLRKENPICWETCEYVPAGERVIHKSCEYLSRFGKQKDYLLSAL